MRAGASWFKYRPVRPMSQTKAFAPSRLPAGEVRPVSVRRFQVLEHREVLDVAGREAGLYRFCGSGDREVGDADAGVAAAPLATELSRTASHGLGHGYPRDQREEPVGGPSL